MARTGRWVASGAVGLALAAGVALFRGERAGGRAEPVRDVDVTPENQDHEEKVRDRRERKAVYTQDLIDGRRTLVEVAGWLLDLYADDPVALDQMLRSHPGESDLEKAARSVVDHVRNRVMSDDEWAGVSARLDQQFRAEFGKPLGARPPW